MLIVKISTLKRKHKFILIIEPIKALKSKWKFKYMILFTKRVNPHHHMYMCNRQLDIWASIWPRAWEGSLHSQFLKLPKMAVEATWSCKIWRWKASPDVKLVSHLVSHWCYWLLRVRLQSIPLEYTYPNENFPHIWIFQNLSLSTLIWKSTQSLSFELLFTTTPQTFSDPKLRI